MRPLYEDHQTQSYSTQQTAGQPSTPTTMMATTTTSDGAPQAGGSSMLETTGTGYQTTDQQATDQQTATPQNPVAGFIAGSDYSREDIELVLSAVSLTLWVATTIYVARKT